MREVIKEVVDRGESTALFEPLKLPETSPYRPELTELAVDLTAKAAGFRRSLPDGVIGALAELVRAMNCYYSNLIEGHDTHPIDIERAMQNDYSREPRKRNLQREARAHVAVQQWIDTGGLKGRASTRDGICETHRRFCKLLPEELLWVEDPDSGERGRVLPGELRASDVRVGAHVPISPGAIARFLTRFEEVYGKGGRAESIISAAAAHHRLLWIHPFLDGNGRVARLMSHATLLEALDSGGIWSIARGLARRDREYKEHLVACDQPRQGDMDGRGALSERALVEFSGFFLETSIDQVQFMEGLVQPNRLRDRILIWTEEEVRAGQLPSKAGAVLEAVLFRGQLPRADVAALVGTGERQARRVVSALLAAGVVSTTGARAPLTIAFPARLAGRWLPGLFPEAA
ncbi:MAG: Fic family protein [Steroidobacteraceae bacterium]